MKLYTPLLLGITTCALHAANISKPAQTKEAKKIAELNGKMWTAVAENKLPALKKLFAKKLFTKEIHPNIDATNENIDTILFVAAWKGDTEMLNFIIQQGAQLDIQNFEGRTALITATMHGRTEIIKQLIAAHAQPNIKDNTGKTALMYAAGLWGPGAAERVKLLVAGGANETITNENDGNKTALDYAFDRPTMGKAIEEGKALRAEYVKAYHERQKLAQQEIERKLISPLASLVTGYAYEEESPQDLPE